MDHTAPGWEPCGGVLIWLDNREWLIFHSIEAVEKDEEMELVDLSDGDIALQWTQRFHGDDFIVTSFESLLRECVSGAYFDDDAGVLEHVAQKLKSGELLVWGRKWGFAGMTSAKAEPKYAPPFDPAERKKYQPDAPKSEPEEGFPDSADLVAIADVMKQAAQEGVPFCEECERARQQRAAEVGAA
jgi:hypothetical protein